MKKSHRGMFPPSGTYFETSIGNKVFDSKVDLFCRFYISFYVRDLLNFEINRIVAFTKNSERAHSLFFRKATKFSV